MWLRFSADFDWKPRPQITIAYKAGSIANVTRACAASAVSNGVAEKTERPK